MITLVVLFLLLLPDNAHAYLDPGTGSIIIQAVIAAVLGAAFTIKMYWRRIKDFFAGKTGTDDDENSSNK